jgi:hypothetical protein
MGLGLRLLHSDSCALADRSTSNAPHPSRMQSDSYAKIIISFQYTLEKVPYKCCEAVMKQYIVPRKLFVPGYINFWTATI